MKADSFFKDPVHPAFLGLVDWRLKSDMLPIFVLRRRYSCALIRTTLVFNALALCCLGTEVIFMFWTRDKIRLTGLSNIVDVTPSSDAVAERPKRLHSTSMKQRKQNT